MHAEASAASARHTQQLEALQKTHEAQMTDERAQWRMQRDDLEAAAAEQQTRWEQQQSQWHEQRSQWEQQLAEQQGRWDRQRRRLEEAAAAAQAAPDSECAQCDSLRKQVQQLSRTLNRFYSAKLGGRRCAELEIDTDGHLGAPSTLRQPLIRLWIQGCTCNSA